MDLEVIGVTGHQDLPPLALRHLEDFLTELPEPFRVVCALAAGADQFVAQWALDHGGSLDLVVPCSGYERSFATATARANYQRLSSLADERETLDFLEPSEVAYLEAGKHVAEACDWLLAVWDGEPSRGLGGTGDIVQFAEGVGKHVAVVWPEGLSR